MCASSVMRAPSNKLICRADRFPGVTVVGVVERAEICGDADWIPAEGNVLQHARIQTPFSPFPYDPCDRGLRVAGRAVALPIPGPPTIATRIILGSGLWALGLVGFEAAPAKAPKA